MTESNVPRELAWGLHGVNQTRLNVTSAVGCEHIADVPPLRIHCPPEVVLIELLPAQHEN